ncbi:MAG: Gfo/Idh/MocA family oxidoreductase [Planctomycetaceae bacterium]|jgi:predicted dehydrogenase|nr:Gfo/Idh/MocA family oxidoreductase [Planctomycetaceae bacterium]
MTNNTSRRRFLKESTLGIAAAAVPAELFPLSASVRAQENRAKTTVPNPNSKIGLAVIGTGGRAKSHLAYFQKDPRVTILYIVDPDPKRLDSKLIDSIAETQNGLKPKAVADMRNALDDNAVDAITCATTNHWHALTGIWALQAGKHAYLEKPISHNIYEGLALEAAVKKYKKVIQTGTQCRSNPANIEAVAFVQSGGIGEVKFARGLCYKRRKAIGALGKYPVPKGIDYNLWSGPAPIIDPVTRPNFHYDWHWQRLYGNGDLGNQGPHQTDIARWHLGLDRFPNAILTYGGRLGYDKENPDKNNPNYVDAGDTANTEITVYDYGDKCIVFETRGLQTLPLTIPKAKPDDKLAGASIGVIVYGSKGYLVQSAYERSAAYDLDGNLIKKFEGGSDASHYKNFIEAVMAGDPSKVTAPARCGSLSAAMSHLGNISYYLGEKNKVSVAEVKTALKQIKCLDDIEATVDRTEVHLKTSGVDLTKTPLSMGTLLQYDSTANKFTGEAAAAANEMLTREYRKPFVVPKPEEV